MASLRTRPGLVDAVVAALITAFVQVEILTTDSTPRWGSCSRRSPSPSRSRGGARPRCPPRRRPSSRSPCSGVSPRSRRRSSSRCCSPLLGGAQRRGGPRGSASRSPSPGAGERAGRRRGDGPGHRGAWFAGRLVRAREEDARRLRELAEALEHERVEQARLATVRSARGSPASCTTSSRTRWRSSSSRRGRSGCTSPPGQESTDRALRSIEATGRAALAEMRRLVGLLRDDERAPALAPRPSLDNLEGSSTACATPGCRSR